MYDRDDIRVRLEEAGATLLSMPGSHGPRSPGCSMPEFAQKAVEAYGWSRVRLRAGRPSAEAIDRMDESLAWIGLIVAQPGAPSDAELFSPHGGVLLRKIVWARLLVRPLSWQLDPGNPQYIFNWAKISRAVGADRRVVPTWHGIAMGTIAALAPAPKNQDVRPKMFASR